MGSCSRVIRCERGVSALLGFIANPRRTAPRCAALKRNEHARRLLVSVTPLGSARSGSAPLGWPRPRHVQHQACNLALESLLAAILSLA